MFYKLEHSSVLNFCPDLINHSKKNHLKAVEDAIEGNDNNFDGIINNMPEDAPSESTLKKAKEYEKLIEKKDEVVKVAKPHKQDLGEIVR